MSPEMERNLAVVRRQLDELDALAKQTLQDLNTVAGTERVTKWKARTAAILTQTVGPLEGQTFANLQPGPSFTHDLVEEFTDLIEYYKTPLTALASRLARLSTPPDRG
jgi:hypothetical protein